jgi:hypothetical protein
MFNGSFCIIRDSSRTYFLFIEASQKYIHNLSCIYFSVTFIFKVYIDNLFIKKIKMKYYLYNSKEQRGILKKNLKILKIQYY